MKTRGFSLIELMVVIAIVAVLAAIALPAYKAYVIRTKVSNFYSMLFAWQQELVTQYQQKGVYPTSYTFDGVTVPAETDTNVNDLGILYVQYRFPNNMLYVSFVLDPDAIDLPPAVYTVRSGSFEDAGGAMKTVCGTWVSGDNEEIPAIYRPSFCTCNDMWGVFTGGTSCS